MPGVVKRLLNNVKAEIDCKLTRRDVLVRIYYYTVVELCVRKF